MKAEQPKLAARRLVFIDETAVTTKMTRLYGRAPIGERLVAIRSMSATSAVMLLAIGSETAIGSLACAFSDPAHH